MLKLPIKEIIHRIERGVTFEAEALDRSFRIKINEYVPFVCTAIHDGHGFRDELRLKTVLSDYERWYEEDPHTADFVSSMPIVLAGLDSRFEYDLNRAPEVAVYDTAWGKKVWNKPLTKSEKQRSLEKHTNYYKVTRALISKIESLYDGCIVYDMHTYNRKRWDREVPVFNIGSERIDHKKFDRFVNHWAEQLRQIELPSIKSTTEVNDVFQGKGYNLAFITQHFDNTLVLATEASKIYCDELTGESYPAIVKALQDGMKQAILDNANYFAKEMTNWEHKKSSKLLSRDLEKELLKVDRGLFQMVKSFELLRYINPSNVDTEKKRFFQSRCTENPGFTYKPLRIDPFKMKRQLYQLEVEKINDVNFEYLYQSTIHAYADKIDMLATLGTPSFLYNNLRYFGEPSQTDIDNAHFILHLKGGESDYHLKNTLDVNDAVKLFQESFDSYGFQGKIEVSKKMVATAMVLNQKKKVMLKKDATFSPKGLKFLAHHEIGVHMVTTMNSNEQPLKIFNIGLPLNTLTQEGLAVLAEYLSGNFTMKRLRELAIRVIAVHNMVRGDDFKKVYRTVVNDYGMDVNEAFYLVTRVFRGGGCTKDYLYLRGFRDIYKFWEAGSDLSPLLIGKTNQESYATIVEMMERGLLKRPSYVTIPFLEPKLEDNDKVFKLLVDGLR